MKYENQIRFIWKFLGIRGGIKHKRISRKYEDYTIDTQEIVDFLIFLAVISTILNKNTETIKMIKCIFLYLSIRILNGKE